MSSDNTKASVARIRPPNLSIYLLGDPHFDKAVAGERVDDGAVPVEQVKLSLPSVQLLALLTLTHPHAIARDRIIDQIYPDADPAKSRRLLSETLYKLRQDLGNYADVIMRADDALALDPQAVWVDVHAFQHHAASAQLDDWLQAIKLYRGDFLMGSSNDWIDARRNELYEQFVAVLARSIPALSRLGRVAEALNLARRWAKLEPYHEPAHMAVMRCAAQLNLSAESLRQYDHMAALLKVEMGIEPSSKAKQLAEKIRADALAKSAEASELARLRPFIGRRAERAAFIRALERLVQGPGQIILLEGDSGIGKTRLLEELVSSAQWREVLTGFGEVQPQNSANVRSGGFAPFDAILQTLLEGVRSEWVREALVLPDATWLQLVATATVANRPNADAAASTVVEMHPTQLSDAIARVVLCTANREPLLLVLDDVQWASGLVVDVVRSLIPHIEKSRLLLVLSYRTEEVRSNGVVWQLLQELDRDQAPLRMQLLGLSEHESAELAQALGRTLTANEIIQLHQKTRGNPLYIETAFEDPTSLRTVQRLFANRLTQLTPEARTALEVAAILGRSFPLALWESVVGPVINLARVLPELLSARMLYELTTESPSHRATVFAFRHDFLREQVCAGLLPQRKRALHLQVAKAMQYQHTSVNESTDSGLAAWHFEQANAWRDALRLYTKAGNDAEVALAHNLALDHYANALAVAEHLPARDAKFARLKILCRRQLVYGMQLRIEAWRKDIVEIEKLANEFNTLVPMITALEARMSLSLLASDAKGIRNIGDSALRLAQETNNGFAYARIANILGFHLINTLHRVRRGTRLLSKAYEFADAADDHALLIAVLGNWSVAQCLNGNCHNARDLALHALKLSQLEPRYYAARAEALNALGFAEGHLGNWAAAQAALSAAIQRHIELNNIWQAAEAIARLANVYAYLGQFDQAIVTAERLFELGHKIGVSQASEVWHWAESVIADIHVQAGNFAVAEQLLLPKRQWIDATHDSRYVFMALHALGRLSLAQERADLAMAHLARLKKFWQKHPSGEVRHILLYVDAAMRAGLVDEAAGVLTQIENVLVNSESCLHRIPLHFLRFWVDSASGYTERAARAQRAIQAGWHELQRQAQQIKDPAARHQFVEQVWLNKRVGDLYHKTMSTTATTAKAAADARLSEAHKPAHVREHFAATMEKRMLTRIHAPKGRRLGPGDQIEVCWTVDAGPSDSQFLLQHNGKKQALRLHRICRLAEEARAQGALPTFADLAAALRVNERTIQRDFKHLRVRGVAPQTRREE